MLKKKGLLGEGRRNRGRVCWVRGRVCLVALGFSGFDLFFLCTVLECRMIFGLCNVSNTCSRVQEMTLIGRVSGPFY